VRKDNINDIHYQTKDPAAFAARPFSFGLLIRPPDNGVMFRRPYLFIMRAAFAGCGLSASETAATLTAFNINRCSASLLRRACGSCLACCPALALATGAQAT
jgi:hypothetical protein